MGSTCVHVSPLSVPCCHTDAVTAVWWSSLMTIHWFTEFSTALTAMPTTISR